MCHHWQGRAIAKYRTEELELIKDLAIIYNLLKLARIDYTRKRRIYTKNGSRHGFDSGNLMFSSMKFSVIRQHFIKVKYTNIINNIEQTIKYLKDVIEVPERVKREGYTDVYSYTVNSICETIIKNRKFLRK